MAKGWKKVASSETHSLFKNGAHELKVAHKALSPKLQKQLAELPHYDEGGGVQRGNDTDSDVSYPVDAAPQADNAPTIEQAPSNRIEQAAERYEQTGGTSPAPPAAAPVAAAPPPAAPVQPHVSMAPQAARAPAADQDVDDNAAPAQAPASAPPAAAPDASAAAPDANGNQANYQKGFADYQKEHAQTFGAEDAAFQHDLANGHITPETYSNLYGKKDTLGKIGMIFGMLMSGAGSGLSHQPNALLGMMNNEIQNDLKAQETSKGNAQNFLKINQQQQLNNAEIDFRKKQGSLTDQQAASMKQEVAIKARTFAQMQANRGVLDSLVKKAQMYPPGSKQWQDAQNALAMVSSAVDGQNYNLGSVAASKLAYLNMGANGFGGAGNGAPSDGAVNYQRMNQLERMSQMKMPGAPSSEDLGAMTKEATSLEEARALRTDFTNAFDSLDKKFLAGTLSPNDRDSYVNSLAGKLAKASAGRYNKEEATAQINSMIPQKGDWGNTRGDKRKNNNSFFDILESGTPTLNRFGVKNAPKADQSAGPQYKTVGGVKYMRGPNGEAVRVK